MNRRLLAHIATTIAGSVVFAGSLAAATATMLARQVVNPPRGTKDPVRVVKCQLTADGSDTGTITLQRTTESEIIGEYTLHWDSGRGRAHLGKILRLDTHTVTRQFTQAAGTPIMTARTVRVASAPQRDIRDLGLPWQDVAIPGELGEMPAWYVPGAASSKNWMIHVHGRGAARTEPLRTVPIAHAHGWNSLIVSYRNDRDAPAPIRRKYGLGLTEWHDVDAAMEWAIAHGAQRIALVGWSMGAAIAAQAYFNSALRDQVVGLMFESPALDWHETLRYQAAQMHVPAAVAELGMWLLRSPFHGWLLGTEAPLDIERLNLIARADELTVPMLLLHSRADTMVPVGASRQLAQLKNGLIDYVEFPNGRHTRLWNVDQNRWEAAVKRWVIRLGAAPQPCSANNR